MYLIENNKTIKQFGSTHDEENFSRWRQNSGGQWRETARVTKVISSPTAHMVWTLHKLSQNKLFI